MELGGAESAPPTPHRLRIWGRECSPANISVLIPKEGEQMLPAQTADDIRAGNSYLLVLFCFIETRSH
jgi:hypothetical protein